MSQSKQIDASNIPSLLRALKELGVDGTELPFVIKDVGHYSGSVRVFVEERNGLKQVVVEKYSPS